MVQIQMLFEENMLIKNISQNKADISVLSSIEDSQKKLISKEYKISNNTEAFLFNFERNLLQC